MQTRSQQQVQQSTDRLLGELVESMRNVRDDISGIRTDLKAQDERSSMSRKAMHEKQEEMSWRLRDVEKDFDDLAGKVNDMKAVTDQVTAWKHAGMGVIAVAGIASSAITALIASYWSEIAKLFRGVG